MKVFIFGIAVALILIAVQSLHAAPSADSNNRFLDAMSGDWIMNGTTLGKPTKYSLHGERALKGGFMRLEMIDTTNPPKYQASVYIGYDAKKNDFIAHWLDQYGAPGARVVAEGHRAGDTLVLLFPYAEGAFRDTFSLDRQANAWSWLLESQEVSGKWTVFATYRLTKQ